jgi:hypothetical protein
VVLVWVAVGEPNGTLTERWLVNRPPSIIPAKGLSGGANGRPRFVGDLPQGIGGPKGAGGGEGSQKMILVCFLDLAGTFSRDKKRLCDPMSLGEKKGAYGETNRRWPSH